MNKFDKFFTFYIELCKSIYTEVIGQQSLYEAKNHTRTTKKVNLLRFKPPKIENIRKRITFEPKLQFTKFKTDQNFTRSLNFFLTFGKGTFFP